MVTAKGREERIRRLRPSILTRWRYRCANPYCRVPLSQKRLDLHHVVKRSQGGEDSLDNLVPLCRRCHDLTDQPSGQARRLVIKADPLATAYPGQAYALGFRFWWA